MLDLLVEQLQRTLRWITPQVPRPKEAEKDLMHLEERVTLYFNLENTLRKFFSITDYCLKNCISKKESLYFKEFTKKELKRRLPMFRRGIPGIYGCCPEDFSSFLRSFNKERFSSKDIESIKEFDKKKWLIITFILTMDFIRICG